METDLPITCDMRARNSNWYDAIEILIVSEAPGKPRAVATQIVMSEIQDGLQPQPSITLSREKAQHLMDELWHCGLRPTEGHGSAGAFAAQGRHLEDMRKLVGKAYGREF